MNLLRAVTRSRPAQRHDDYHLFQGNQYLNQYLQNWEPNREGIGTDFAALVSRAYKGNSIVFACEATRVALLSQALPVFRRLRSGRRGDTFGTAELSVLERPWPGGNFGSLAARMVLDADFGGTAFVARRAERPDRLMRMRPDWVTMVLGSEEEPEEADKALDADLLGVIYHPGGVGSNRGTIPLMADEVAVWAPVPDPLAAYRGMPWVTAALREVEADVAATVHKGKFFENGATPGVMLSVDPSVKMDAFQRFYNTFNERHQGVANAYRTIAFQGVTPHAMGKDFQQLDFKATQGAGEPLALDTPIPTPAGWTTMGDIAVGDQVIGRDGKPANVAGVSPVHVGRDCYRITLKDRTSIVADASHLWVAVDRNTAKRAERQYTTEQLFDLFTAPYSNGVGGHRLTLPAAPIVELAAVDLLVDPYVLGAWLGDGQTAGAAICGDHEDLKFIAAEIESRGYITTRWSTAPDKVDVIGLPGGLLAALRALGVLGGKRIPAGYLRASEEQRLDLLRGLMDTDGTVDPTKGTCEFSSKDEHLARQVAELLRSLGYRATVSSKVDVRSRTGETWRVFFRVAQDRVPFLLPRKVDRCVTAGEPHVSDARGIVSIEKVESVPVRCIAVDTPDHLFLAGDGFVPTHNTRIAAASGVHPVVAALSEGMSGSSLNAGNFRAACRLVADRTLIPAWASMFAALSTIVPGPDDAELWYDKTEISFLQEDRKDAAEIELIKAQTIVAYVRDGFTPASAAAAVEAEDTTQLVHSGLVSVQLQPPGTNKATIDGSTTPPAIGAGGQA